MNEDQKASLNKAQISVQAADYLLKGGFFNQAASEAYYAMFYTAEALLLDEQLEFSSHHAVISAFGRVFAKKGIIDPEFHGYLLQGFAARIDSDYDRHRYLSENAANEAITRAKAFVAMGTARLAAPPDDEAAP